VGATRLNYLERRVEGMRFAVLVATGLLLAGCSSPPDAETTAPEEVAAAVEGEQEANGMASAESAGPVLLVDGTYTWHEPRPVPYVIQTPFNLATQTVSNPCLSQDGSPFFNNLRLPVRAETAPSDGALTITLDWTDVDFLGKTLVLAYKSPGDAAFTVTDRIPRATETVLPVVAAATPAEDGEGITPWDLWLCLNGRDDGVATPGWQNGPFTGAVRVQATFSPAATGAVPTQPAL
jgi:hypothetical protein